MRSAVAVLLVACNQVYGLGEVEEHADIDGDGVQDLDDNCIAVKNPDQIDTDRDGRGDACDSCPTLATPVDHDEDGDLLGDACDPCPVRPSFAVDIDQDGVEDACDPDTAVPSHVVVFEPFVTLDPTMWTTTGVPWRTLGDRVAPSAIVPADAPGLARVTADIVGDSWLVEIGVSSAKVWNENTRFGIVLESAPGMTALSCIVTCYAPNSCIVTDNFDVYHPVMAEPFARLRMVLDNTNGLSCSINEPHLNTVVGPLLNPAAIVLVTQPDTPIDYVYAVLSP